MFARIARISVSMFGSISLRRINNKNYKGHAKQRAYDEVKFDRVVVNFMGKSGASAEKVGFLWSCYSSCQCQRAPERARSVLKFGKVEG